MSKSNTRKEKQHQPLVREITPAEQGFYSKIVDYQGIPVKSSDEVDNRALHEAWQRLHMMLKSTPSIVANLVANEAHAVLVQNASVCCYRYARECQKNFYCTILLWHR